jgi:hypothetical protein
MNIPSLPSQRMFFVLAFLNMKSHNVTLDLSHKGDRDRYRSQTYGEKRQSMLSVSNVALKFLHKGGTKEREERMI